MKSIYQKLAIITASAAIATTVATTAQSAQVTYEFEGPINSSGISPEKGEFTLGDFVTGSVTFDTNVLPVDISGFGDLGDRLLYPDAIVDFSFSTGVFEWSFQGGNIQLWNDYQRCIAKRTSPPPMVCLQRQLEMERLSFEIDASTQELHTNAQLIILGNSADFLTSSLLPTTPPKDSHIYRVDLFWDVFGEETDISIASNNIRLVRESVPEPAFIWGLLTIGFFGTGSVLKKTAQKDCSK